MCILLCLCCSHTSDLSSIDSDVSLSCSSTHHSSPLPHGTLQNTHLSFPSPSHSSRPPSHRSTESQQERGFCPWCRGGFKGRGEEFKADFLKPKPGERGLRALGALESWDLPFVSPIFSLYTNGNLPLGPHCLWDTGLHSYGVLTRCYSFIYLPTPSSPACKCVWETFFRAGGLEGSWSAQLGPGNPS